MAGKNKRIKDPYRNRFKLAFVLLVIAIILVLIFLGTSIIDLKLKEQKYSNNENEEFQFVPRTPLMNSTVATMYLPAVDKDGNGVVTLLVVEAVQGSGRTLVDIDNLMFWGDTQQSIRKAKRVAANITGKGIDNYDLVYNIYANASIVGGESAGAALTIATIAAIQNKTPSNNTIITGTINHDGTIGPVNGILAKAQAAKAFGAVNFLVPLTQSEEIGYESKKHCETIGPTEICNIEQIPVKINISEQVDINVVEIENIRQALGYFLG